MPSPFPGMDPYLEDPQIWPSLHYGLMSLMWLSVSEALPPGYAVDFGERLYIEPANREIIPDVFMLKHRRRGNGATTSSAAVLDEPAFVRALPAEEVREPYLEILAPGRRSKVISVVEILSPKNKASGAEGRRKYQEKQQTILASPTHLVEIDLLRAGPHTVAPPRSELIQIGTYDYLVSLSRATDRERHEVWLRTVRQRLPRFAIPLAGDDPDVRVDLQALFERCYDTANYMERIDYRRPPVIPLSPADNSWAIKLLRQNGLRPKR